MKSKGLNAYITFGEDGAFASHMIKPTDEIYKIKLVSVGSDYIMSYMKTDGTQMFFGYDQDEGKLVESSRVTDISEKSRINFETIDSVGQIIVGHFGESPAYVVDAPGLNAIGDCRVLYNEFQSDRKPGLISMSFIKDDNECRYYRSSDENYSHDPDATDAISTCIDPTKNINQACLIAN